MRKRRGLVAVLCSLAAQFAPSAATPRPRPRYHRTVSINAESPCLCSLSYANLRLFESIHFHTFLRIYLYAKPVHPSAHCSLQLLNRCRPHFQLLFSRIGNFVVLTVPQNFPTQPGYKYHRFYAVVLKIRFLPSTSFFCSPYPHSLALPRRGVMHASALVRAAISFW